MQPGDPGPMRKVTQAGVETPVTALISLILVGFVFYGVDLWTAHTKEPYRDYCRGSNK